MFKFSGLTASFCLALAIAPGGAAALTGAVREDSTDSARTLMVLRSGPHGSSFCTGIVLSRDVLLTAAHCVEGRGATLAHYRDSEGKPAMLAIRAVSVHPGYRANAIATRQRSIDLALVQLAEPLDGRFQPVTLARGAPIAIGERFRISGYGIAREGAGSSGGVLRSGVIAARAPISEILLWAEDPSASGIGACEGDSGGPIFSQASGALVAVTSWAAGEKGKRCGKLTQGVLVDPQRGWIDSVMQGWR